MTTDQHLIRQKVKQSTQDAEGVADDDSGREMGRQSVECSYCDTTLRKSKFLTTQDIFMSFHDG